MSLVDLVVIFILGLHPDWRPDYCESVNMRGDLCRAKQEEGYSTAQLLAPIFVEESERAGLGATGAFHLACVAMKENSLKTGDQCILNIIKERLASIEELECNTLGERRVRLCVNLDGGARQSCRNAIVLDETDEKIKVNYCMAGEVGLFQLTRYEAASGTVVPATGEALPRSLRERRDRLMDPQVNTSLAAAAMARLRDHCCSTRTEDDRPFCEENWGFWIGAYNTGSCATTRAMEYAGRIEAYYRRGIEYLCSQAPDADVCPRPVEETPEDPTE